MAHLRVQSEAVLEKRDGDGLPSHESGRTPCAAEGSARNDDLVVAVGADETVEFVDSAENDVKVRPLLMLLLLLLLMMMMERGGAAAHAALAPTDATTANATAADVATHGRDVLAEIGCRRERGDVLVNLKVKFFVRALNR